MLLFIFFQIGTVIVSDALMFENITYDIFPMNSGIIAAFGHINIDEFTDVFSLQQGGNKLQIFLGTESGQQFQPYINCTFDSVITSVVPGDFNGDSVMDILITLMSESDLSTRNVKVLWGKDGNIDCKSSTICSIVNQPMIVDFNGDMIPDIIGETKDGKRNVWISSYEKIFASESLNVTNKFASPHSSGLIDLNDDLAADMLIMTEDNIEVWINNGKKFVINGSISYPNISFGLKLQSTFVDLNLDAKIDLIMPVCEDMDCHKSAILMLNSSSKVPKWQMVFDNFKYQNITWGFKLPKGHNPLDLSALPVTLRAGDIDMDGYPDFITVLEPKSKLDLKSRLVIIKNRACYNGSHCVHDRSLEIIWEVPGLNNIPGIEIAAFFDIFEDGTLDILASSRDKSEWKIHAFKNSEILDSCFMKVLVLSGLCKNCSINHMPYGVNQPGPLVRYNMTKQDGHPLVSSSIQISQTAYFPLHLPYAVFGLGQTPNFVDALTIAIPVKFNKSVHKREWTQIIPNSQIVVIPHPPQDEKKWVRKLFVTPSHYVLLTCIALVGTCAFIAVIVALLHWKERKEDKKEKMQDAYRFHFDAM